MSAASHLEELTNGDIPRSTIALDTAVVLIENSMTDRTVEQKEAGVIEFSKDAPNETDPNDPGSDATPIVRAEARMVLEPMKVADARLDEISGTVLNVAQDSLLCEVNARNGLVQVLLPKDLLPEARYGMPILIRMDEVDGIRRPTVLPRQVEAEEDEEIDRLLRRLQQS